MLQIAKIVLTLGSLFAMTTANACTGVRLTADDKSVVVGRTMELAPSLHSKIMTIPKGIRYVGLSNTGINKGKKWDVKYPIAGTNGLDLPYIVDGINSEGLAVGSFYFTGYAKYQESTKDNESSRLAAWELPTYLLSQYATVEEVKKGLESINVIGAALVKDQPLLELHYAVHDASGKSIVIEYVDGKLNIHDNPIGVITNAPTFDWHITNLNNYVNLTPNNALAIKMADVEFNALGNGSGLHGLPGDFTPPSRFVRAALLSHSYVPASTGKDAVSDVFHILNQFDIPKGVVHGSNGIEQTQWTTAADLKEKKYYYHTYEHRDVGMIDLTKLDPNSKKIEYFPMDKSVN